MIPRWFNSLLLGDRILIVGYMVFILTLVIILAVMSSAENQRKAVRKLSTWAEKWETFTALFHDDEPYEAEWMDRRAWELTRERRL